jgi:hypothetical protein
LKTKEYSQKTIIMNIQDVKDQIFRARHAQIHQMDSASAQLLSQEILKLEDTVKDAMGKPYRSFSGTKEIPEKVRLAVEYLASCHGI